MIKLKDWLIEYNSLGELYALSHSQYIEDFSTSGRDPYHIGRLNTHLFENMRDCLHNFKQNKWQIVFIGSFRGCTERISDLRIMKKWDIGQLEDWQKKTFVEYCEDEEPVIKPAPRMDEDSADNEFLPGVKG